MPREIVCDHPNCCGLPCKQLTPEELKPRDDDFSYAKQLISGGWLSVSSKFQCLARFTDKWPTAEQLIRPEMFDTKPGKEMAKNWLYTRRNCSRQFASGNSEFVEVLYLTVKEFRAFKRLGGQAA